MTAVARALHLEQPPPWVLVDDLATPLAGDEGVAIRDLLVSDLPLDALHAFTRSVCVRARYPEDIVERAARDGVTQYVILGAGLDSLRSARNLLPRPSRMASTVR